MLLRFFLFSLLLITFSCAEQGGGTSEIPETDRIIASAIDHHFGKAADSLAFSFVFRDRSYSVERHGGKFLYSGAYSDSLGNHSRFLDNLGYREFLNGDTAVLPVEVLKSHQSSLNSVLYFMLLPIPLKDEAVKPIDDGMEDLKGKSYHKLEVRFHEMKGGEDHEDVYYYWFDPEDGSMDYLAYSYLEDDGEGTRFRKAINKRRIQGILFQDYENYKGPADMDSLAHVSELFNAGSLELLSLIESHSIDVKYPHTAE